jgi:hypothetical protein
MVLRIVMQVPDRRNPMTFINKAARAILQEPMGNALVVVPSADFSHFLLLP